MTNISLIHHTRMSCRAVSRVKSSPARGVRIGSVHGTAGPAHRRNVLAGSRARATVDGARIAPSGIHSSSPAPAWSEPGCGSRSRRPGKGSEWPCPTAPHLETACFKPTSDAAGSSRVNEVGADRWTARPGASKSSGPERPEIPGFKRFCRTGNNEETMRRHGDQQIPHLFFDAPEVALDAPGVVGQSERVTKQAALCATRSPASSPPGRRRGVAMREVPGCAASAAPITRSD